VLAIGIWAYWHAVSTASLSMTYCHNEYGASATDWQCRKVFYYGWGGVILFAVGMSLVVVGFLWLLLRFLRR
jgi:hypothetical protein